MDKIELKERMLKGEDFHTEFNESLPDNEALAWSIVCFANADGGLLIIGASDSGAIIGVSNLDEGIRRFEDVAFNRCELPVSILAETVEEGGKTVLIVRIPKGQQRPYIGLKAAFTTYAPATDAGRRHGRKCEGYIRQVKASILMKRP